MILTKENIDLTPISGDFLSLLRSKKIYNPELFGQFMIEPEEVLDIENKFKSKGISPYLYGESFNQSIENKSIILEELYDENSLDNIKVIDPIIVWGIGKYYQKVG